MKYAIKTEIVIDTKSKQDTLAKNIADMLVGKGLWADASNPTIVAKGLSEDNKPVINALLRFEDKAERDEVALFIEDKIARIPALSGSVRIHRCFHDQPELNKSCEAEVEI